MVDDTNSNFEFPSMSAFSTWNAGVIQAQVYRNLKKATTKILKQHDLTMAQWFILGKVYDSGKRGIRMTDLAKNVSVTMPYLSKTMAALEKKKMVEKIGVQTDRRSSTYHVTTNMAPRVAKIEEMVREDLKELLFPEITPEELFTYVKVLFKLSQIELEQ